MSIIPKNVITFPVGKRYFFKTLKLFVTILHRIIGSKHHSVSTKSFYKLMCILRSNKPQRRRTIHPYIRETCQNISSLFEYRISPEMSGTDTKPRKIFCNSGNLFGL